MAVFNYNNGYKNKMAVGVSLASPAVIGEVEFDFGVEDWCAFTYNSIPNWTAYPIEISSAVPTKMSVNTSFTIPNNSSSVVTYNNVYISVEYQGWGSGSGGQWATLCTAPFGTITIQPNNSAYVSGSAIREQLPGSGGTGYITYLVYSRHPEMVPAMYPGGAPYYPSVRIRLVGNSTTLGMGTLTDRTFDFTYPPIYDCRAFVEHWTDRYAELEPLQTFPSNFSPSDTVDTSIKYIQYSNDYFTRDGHFVGPNVHIYMPEVKIEDTSGEIIFDTNSFDFTPKQETEKKPAVIKNSAAISSLVNYIRNSEITGATSVSWRSYIRNPYKKGDLPLGALVLLDGGYCYTVTNNNGSGYYDSEWHFFDESQHTFSVTPASSVNSLSLSVDADIGYILQDPVRLGVYYTQYTYPIVTVRYTAGWGVKKLTINPKEGLLNVDPITVNLPTSSSDTTTGTIVFTQPNVYPDSFVGENLYAVANIGVSASTNNGTSRNYDYTVGVYKFINLEIIDFDGYRCKSTGEQYVNGSHIGLVLSWNGNPMGTYNRIIPHVTIQKLRDSTIVYDEDLPAIRSTPWTWVSSDEYIDDETSYRVTFTLRDSFRTRIDGANIGTKVAFIEWGDEPGHIAIGKYVETNGLEIQFPTKFYNDVIFLTKGSTHMGEAAAHVPYTDTYNIGASNVQEALNWIFGRLS